MAGLFPSISTAVYMAVYFFSYNIFIVENKERGN